MGQNVRLAVREDQGEEGTESTLGWLFYELSKKSSDRRSTTTLVTTERRGRGRGERAKKKRKGATF